MKLPTFRTIAVLSSSGSSSPRRIFSPVLACVTLKMKALHVIGTSVTAYHLIRRNVWGDLILIFNLILNLMLHAFFILALQSWLFPEGFLCINTWDRVTVINLGTKHIRNLWFCKTCKKCLVEKVRKLLPWIIKALCCIHGLYWISCVGVQLCESVEKWKHYWFDKRSDIIDVRHSEFVTLPRHSQDQTCRWNTPLHHKTDIPFT